MSTCWLGVVDSAAACEAYCCGLQTAGTEITDAQGHKGQCDLWQYSTLKPQCYL